MFNKASGWTMTLKIQRINPEYSLEGLMLKVKLQYFDHLMRNVNWLEKTGAGKDWGQDENGVTEDEMVGWHHWLNGYKFEQTPWNSAGQGSLVCCSPWGHKKSDTTYWMNNNKFMFLPETLECGLIWK